MSHPGINRLILFNIFLSKGAPAGSAAVAKLPPGGKFCRVIYIALTLAGDAVVQH
jgi:hypothetical protein